MNNKLLLQDLTDQLAEAGKIKKKDAEEFLRAFFKISEDALFEDGIIKINGLGTLKLVLVDARKSVNVTTGEEFEIREHYKVSFAPDSDLKNAVNQPYAHLEPVELDGGSDSNHGTTTEKKSSISKEKLTTTKEKPSDSATNVTDQLQLEEVGSPKDPKKRKRSTILWILFFLLIAALGIWSWISNEKQRKEDAVKIRETELIDSLEADANLQQDLEEISQESGSDSLHSSGAEDSLEATIQSVAQEKGNATPSAAVTEQKKAESLEKKPSIVVKAPIKESIPAKKPTVSAPSKQSTVAPVNKVASPIKQVATTTQEATSKPKLTQDKTSKSTVSTTKPEKSSSKTEYIASVKMENGNRLTLLALKYYGHKAFWVYIYLANKGAISKPDNVTAGTIVKIPKPDPKIIDANNPALVAKAKALQLELIGAQ